MKKHLVEFIGVSEEKLPEIFLDMDQVMCNFLKGAEEKYILSLRNICEKHMTSYYRECNKKESEIIKSILIKYYPNILRKGRL